MSALGAAILGSACGTQGGALCEVENKYSDDLGLRPQVYGPGIENPEAAPYDGPAVVEHSTTKRLLLDYAPDGGSAAAGVDVRRALIESSDPLPILPVGTRLWLTRSPPGPGGIPFYMMPFPQAFAIRTDQQGPLLVGGSWRATLAGLPAITQVEGRNCSAPNRCGGEGDRIFYQSIEVEVDEVVTIEDGHVASVEIDGLTYDVRATARLETLSTDCHVSDYAPTVWSGAGLDIRVQDAAPLIDDLELGELPSCVQGNEDLDSRVYWGSHSTYDGPVTLVGLDGEDATRWEFNLTANRDFFQTPSMPPSLGTDLWLSVANHQMAAVFEAKDGPLLVAQGWEIDPLKAEAVVPLKAWLGVDVTFEKACDYTNGNSLGDAVDYDLYRWIIHTDPPVVVPDRENTTVDLDGVTYQAYQSSGFGTTLTFILYRDAE